VHRGVQHSVAGCNIVWQGGRVGHYAPLGVGCHTMRQGCSLM